MKILCIENDAEQLETLRRGLENEGQRVVGTTSEYEGIRLALSERPDVILLDIWLEKLDGLAVAERLRAVPELEKTVIIGMTAASRPGLRERVLAAGCVGYLEKPFRPSELMSSLNEYVAGHHETLSLEEALRYTHTNSKWFIQRWDDHVHALDDYMTRLRSAELNLIRSERLAATGRLAAVLAHEINNPLQALQSLLDYVISETPEEDARREYLASAREASLRISTLVKNLLSINIPSAEQMTSVDLVEIIGDVVILLRQTAHDSQVEIRFPTQRGVYQVQGARVLLQQLLHNLLLNAIEAMPGGGRALFAAARVGDQLVVSLADTGVGVAPDAHLFEPFVSTKPEGHGLGLYVCYMIARAHQGTLEWRNNKPKGATFVLSLPMGTSA